MLLTTSLILALLQVGPNPQSGALQGTPEELLDRPPRPGEQAAFETPQSAWLAECLALLPQEAARAHSLAQIRRADTYGADRVLANHCLGLAATELGLWEDAIGAFQAARAETPEDELSAKARFGAMAGNAALGSGSPERAIPILRMAKVDAQTAASATLEALASIDLARALVATDQSDEALFELQNAVRLLPNHAEGWLLMATLLRRLDRLTEAQDAIERAGALAPQEGAIGLEAGLIAVLSGRDDAARASWESVIATQPDSLAAQTAENYLAQLGPASEDTTDETVAPPPAESSE